MKTRIRIAAIAFASTVVAAVHVTVAAAARYNARF